jgi:tetratricopeptide (TPR) repeat protein
MKRNIFISSIVVSILIVFSFLIFASGTIDESLPSLIKRIKPSTVIIFAYDDKGEFLQLGSGFFISQNGDVITNYHVIQGANSAEIKTSDGKTYPITYIVAENEQNDVIRLSVNIPSQYVYPLSLSKTIPEVGERIIVYGSPLGWENTVSDGIVSAIREVPSYGKLIQITAPISPGSSGSPVLNMQGEVIGIATFQMIEGQNLNFAIPSERIANLNLTEEEKTFTTEGLFEQKENDKKDFDYVYEATDKALYFIDKKEYEKALTYLEIVIKTDISSLKGWACFQIGYCYGELKSYTKAIEALKQAIRIDPDDADTYYNLGCVYGNIDNHTKAIEAYKQAIRIDPDYANSHYGLGLAYNKLGFDKDAIEEYKQAIRIDPDNTNARINLGITYGELDNYTEAIEAFKQAIRIDPDDAVTYYNLGYAYGNIDNYTKAIEAFKQAIRIDPDNTNAHINLGKAYGELGNYTKAIESFKQAIRINPGYVGAYCNLGYAYYRLGFYKDAVESYKQAARIDSDDAVIHYNLGVSYYELGLYKNAIESFKQAILINPDYVEAYCNLGAAYTLIGDRDLALNEYKILKELDINLANELFDFINK